MNYFDMAKAVEAYTISQRQHFHRNPELSGQEEKTVAHIKAELSGMGIPYYEVENGGVIGIIEGGKGPGRTLLLRADIDALPVMEEATNMSKPRTCVSETPGLMHACGHDAHTAMLLGSGRALNACKDQFSGKIMLMFERGEEGGGNIQYILDYFYENKVKIDGAWGMHVNTDVNTGHISVNLKEVCAGIITFNVTLRGVGGHGSRPDRANSPLDCFAAIYTGLNALRMRCSPFVGLTMSIGKLVCGTGYNTVPDSLNFEGTIRLYSRDEGLKFKDTMVALIENNAEAFGITADIGLYGPTFPLINNQTYAAFARDCLDRELPGYLVEIEPRMGSETMAMTHQYLPGVFAFLGVRNEEKGCCAAGHTPQFDLDEDALKYGVASTLCYALNFLSSDIQATDFTPSPLHPTDLFGEKRPWS